jgi:hypothetical protein
MAGSGVVGEEFHLPKNVTSPRLSPKVGACRILLGFFPSGAGSDRTRCERPVPFVTLAHVI